MIKTQKKVVCIIDDDPLFQYMLKHLIDRAIQGVLYQQYENGRLALDFFENGTDNTVQFPDIIFVDINMPVLNGWEFMDGFAALQFKIYKPEIYIYSSSVDQKDLARASTYEQLNGYLVKPVTPQQLKEILDHLYPGNK